MEGPSALQFILGCFAIASTFLVVFGRNPVASAMFLMFNLFITGALYIGMGAFFIGAAQILIYAGAIAVLFIFMIMLFDLRDEKVQKGVHLSRFLLSAIVAAIFLGVMIYAANSGLQFLEGRKANAPVHELSAKELSENFISKYMVPFQVTGILLTAVIMGAVVWAKGLKVRTENNA